MDKIITVLGYLLAGLIGLLCFLIPVTFIVACINLIIWMFGG